MLSSLCQCWSLPGSPLGLCFLLPPELPFAKGTTAQPSPSSDATPASTPGADSSSRMGSLSQKSYIPRATPSASWLRAVPRRRWCQPSGRPICRAGSTTIPREHHSSIWPGVSPADGGAAAAAWVEVGTVPSSARHGRPCAERWLQSRPRRLLAISRLNLKQALHARVPPPRPAGQQGPGSSCQRRRGDRCQEESFRKMNECTLRAYWELAFDIRYGSRR
jgi:hypothetical protein